MTKMTKKSRRKKVLTHIGKVAGCLISVSLLSGPACAVDASEAAAQAVGAEGGKQALNVVLKAAKGKPALSIAATITCLACIPATAAVAASPAMCVACGILVAKTIG